MQRADSHEQVFCRHCGKAAQAGGAFCPHCGLPMAGEGPSRTYRGLPDLPGVPGVITGVKIVHGWAASYGYLDVHEIRDDVVQRYREVCPQRQGLQFPPEWHTVIKKQKAMYLESVLQNMRFCDTDAACDGTTPVSPRDDRHYLQVEYRAWDGSEQVLRLHADPEYGKDALSVAVARIVESADQALAGGRADECLLVLHRKGHIASVVMNAPLYLMPEYGGREQRLSVVDGATGDAVRLSIAEKNRERVLEAQVWGLCDGWVSREVRIPLSAGMVAQIPVADLVEKTPNGVAVAGANNQRAQAGGFEDWVFACVKRAGGYREPRVDARPFLEGCVLFEAPGTYVLPDWITVIGDPAAAVVAKRPLPDRATAEDPYRDPLYVPTRPARGVGTYRDRRDTSMGLIHRQYQLEESCTYFLTEYLDERGVSEGRYSFDIELAHDIHYSFGRAQEPLVRQQIGAREGDSLAEAMIAFLRTSSPSDLEHILYRVKTSSISY